MASSVDLQHPRKMNRQCNRGPTFVVLATILMTSGGMKYNTKHTILFTNPEHFDISVRSGPVSPQTDYHSEKTLMRREDQSLTEGDVKVFYFCLFD